MTPFVDLHIDTLGRILDHGVDVTASSPLTHVDLPRMAATNTVCAIWAACSAFNYTGLAGTAAAVRMLVRGHDLLARAGKRARLILQAEDLDGCGGEGPVGVVLGLEGAHSLEGSIELLDAFHDLGVRVLTLCWNSDTPFATGCALEGGTDLGLLPAGRELLARAAALGLVLDLAHASPRTISDVLALERRPFMVSHTACAALRSHRRNLTDAQMREVAEAGGLIGITIYPPFLAAEGTVTVATIADHIIHALGLVGEHKVAIGTDFDGITSTPEGIAGLQDMPLLFEELERRGIAGDTIARVAWRNAYGLLRAGLARPA